MIILGFESSCDETGVAAVCTERGLLAHALHTQIAMHQEYGGVVPELASRDHIRRVTPLTRQVLEEAGIGMADVGAVVYTAGRVWPGRCWWAPAWRRRWPGRAACRPSASTIWKAICCRPCWPTPARIPFVALLVSGGHTQLMRVDGVGRYELLGETLDDAAGEAFDKSAC